MKTLIKNVLLLVVLCGSLHLQAQQFTNYTTDNGLPSNAVNGVAVDNANNKWFATSAGVAKFDGTTWTTFTTADGLIDNYVNCIGVDAASHVWAGTDVGVSMFDGTIWTSFTTANGLVNSMINYISGDLDGSVWIATSAGLSNYNGSTWTSYKTAQGLPNDFVSYVAIENAAKRWFGTMLGGLSLYNGSAFTTFTTADSLMDNNIITIAVDSYKNKWIGTIEGITQLDQNDVWVKNLRAKEGLFSKYVKDLACDSRDVLWVGMYDDYLQDGGIAKYSGGNFYTLLVADGLVASSIKRIAVDKNDAIWIATGNGVSKLVDTNIGMKEKDSRNLTIYPNPATTQVEVSVPGYPATLSVVSMVGTSVLTQPITSSRITLDVTSLQSGIYIVKIEAPTITYTKKLIIK